MSDSQSTRDYHYALLTDLYQLTMAQGYWKQGMTKTVSCFHMFFRDNPFKGGYTIAAGTGLIERIVEGMYFDESDVAYLASIEAPGGGKLFESGFLDFLRDFRPRLTIDAVPEGTVVFPREPLVRVIGPVIDCQLIETTLLNIVNFQTLVATKAQRVVSAAVGGTVSEFGLRRAQGPDGGLSASRAAYIGGCSSTSNVLAGKKFGIPVSGTHAHSWVMAFPSELEAFRAYAQTMPKNCTLLVDTYTVEGGVKNAIIVAKEMEARGERLAGVRIDSGDLSELSKMARRMFDEAGLEYVKIIASNDLDEYTVQSLLAQGAPITGWGVGTKLATCFEQPALAGVYKLSAVKDASDKPWRPVVKMSEQAYKLTIPGVLELRRYLDDEGRPVGDMIVDPAYEEQGQTLIVDPMDATLTLNLEGYDYVDLLEPVIEDGVCVKSPETLERARLRVQKTMRTFDHTIKRFMNPQVYPAGIEVGLYNMRTSMVRRTREAKGYTWR